MTILEKLQSAIPCELNNPLNIDGMVYKQLDRARNRYLKLSFFERCNSEYSRNSFTEEEYQVICQKVDEQLQFANYKNNQLLYNTLELAAGDDYDGCFTFMGQIKYDCLHSELERRLIACGFLSEQGIYDFGNHDDFGL